MEQPQQLHLGLHQQLNQLGQVRLSSRLLILTNGNICTRLLKQMLLSMWQLIGFLVQQIQPYRLLR